MSFCDILENAILNHVIGASSYSAPATLYVALSTTTPDDDGTNFTEPSAAAGYTRVAVTNNTTNWPITATSSKKNGTAIVFPDATDAWGTITHFGIFDDLAAGDCLMTGALGTPKTIISGDAATFPIESIEITLD